MIIIQCVKMALFLLLLICNLVNKNMILMYEDFNRRNMLKKLKSISPLFLNLKQGFLI